MTRTIPDYDWNYAHLEWGRGLMFFQSRLRQLGYDKRNGLFLDAGCGTGQWMDALANLGKEVVGVDVRASRLEIASIFLNPHRSHLIRASIEALPFRQGVFRAVICYGVIMYVDAVKAVKEISRTSCQSAALYLCWNAIGWSLRMLLSGKYTLDAKKQALQTILNTWLKRRGTRYYSRRTMSSILTASGFKVLAVDSEGHIALEGSKGSPIYKKGPWGIDNVLEAFGTRN